MRITQEERYNKLEDLFVQFKQAKVMEAEVRGWRINCEEQIAQLIEGPESGSKTVTLESGRKITVKRGINYNADVEGLSLISISDYVAPLRSKTTVSLNIEVYEWYRKNDPVAFAAISKFVETKPKKVAVTIKEKKED